MGLNPSIPNQDELEALKLSIKLDHREDKNIPSEDLLEIVRVVFKNNCFEFDSVIKQQLSGKLLGISVLHRMHVFLWIGWRQFIEKEHLKRGPG